MHFLINKNEKTIAKIIQTDYNNYNLKTRGIVVLSKKIRIIGSLTATLIILCSIVFLCIFSSKNVGSVKEMNASLISQNSVELTWKKVGSADGYIVYRKVDNALEKFGEVDNNEEQKFVAENLDYCTKYDFCIKSYKIFKGNVYESKKYPQNEIFIGPDAQSVSTILLDEGSVLACWSTVDNASGYEIEYSKNEDFSDTKQRIIENSAENEFKIDDLEVDNDYFFRARTYVNYNDERLYGDWSETSCVTVVKRQALDLDMSKPMVAITFDDGPSYNGASSKILETIEKYGIKATFFMIGVNARANPDNVKRKVELGCQIGNHTYDHKKYGKNVSPDLIRRGREAVSQAGGGVEVNSFRSTGGNTTAEIRKECRDEGVALYYWSLDTQDWKYRDAEKVYNSVVDNIRDGDIVLMHEIYDTTAEAFEKIVPELLSQGYQFVTCDELVLAKTGKPPVPGEQYMNGTTIKNNTK